MESGCLGQTVRQSMANLTGLLVMELKKPLRKRNYFGKRESQILGDYDRPGTMPLNSTWYVMTEIPGLKYKDVGNLYGCRIGLNMA